MGSIKAYMLAATRYDQDGCKAFSDTRCIIIGDGKIKQDSGEYKPLMPEDYWYGSTFYEERLMLEYGWDEVAEVWVLEIPDQFARCEEGVIRKYVEDTPDSEWRLLKSVRLSAFFREQTSA